jgi:hypothetical protein
MNPEHLKTYLQGRDAFRAGDTDEALKLIANSLGTDQPTDIMRDALPELANLNDAALVILLHRSKDGK